jgi:hypothetical protein
MYLYLPSLYLKDGTMAFSGYLFKSLIFGGSYFGAMKLIDYLSAL